jgi:AraC-like DNA-binding protein
MSILALPSRAVSWSLDPAPRPSATEPSPEWRGVVSVLAAADQLASISDYDGMLKRAVELARESIGLERVGLYVRDRAAGRVMRGTWGTSAKGETTDERTLYFECSEPDYEALRQIQIGGALWMRYENAPHIAQEPGRSVVLGHGWIALTPLVSGGELVGVMYNDTAISHGPLDEGKQVRAAVFASLLASLIIGRQTSGLVRLARELGISPGHLARSFKTEMGVSVVKYRNRLRIERFFSLVDQGGANLLDAALGAGFGSYSQFHRVFRKLIGTTPREYLIGRRAQSMEPPSGVHERQIQR